MSNTLMIETTILTRFVKNDLPLEERVKALFEFARNEHAWMWLHESDERSQSDCFKVCVAALMSEAKENGLDADFEVLERSLESVKVVSAMLQGVPVDAEAVLARIEGETIPLMGLWHEAKAEKGA